MPKRLSTFELKPSEVAPDVYYLLVWDSDPEEGDEPTVHMVTRDDLQQLRYLVIVAIEEGVQ
jgi:hypothetical protein